MYEESNRDETSSKTVDSDTLNLLTNTSEQSPKNILYILKGITSRITEFFTQEILTELDRNHDYTKKHNKSSPNN
ncbi:predicted protein [Chaetoceros tenuissimus]|uniref:Uncharacterized protein n=1 Tax=Chaetoceros tenuissimus TaxID=426638 RepID=A0AAD3CU72_9STRA|nr:predicted protein [Chaetoceros tenuissimus]